MAGTKLHAGWDLHFDVTLGCAGDMLVGALIDAGASAAALKKGLTDAGLLGVGPLIEQERRGGLLGTKVTFVDALGLPLEGAPTHRQPHLAANPPSRPGSRRSGPAPHRHLRPVPSVAEVGKTGESDSDEQGDGEGAVILAGPGAGEVEPQAPPGQIARWLEEEPARASELLDLLKASRLDPVTRALVLKTARLLFSIRGRVRGESLQEQVLPGRPALDVLCDVVGVCALVTSLDPGQITCSRVTVSTAPVQLDGELQPGPATWVLGCLEGLAVDERDLPHACTTPTGAALLGALCRRSGPRRAVRERAFGVGLGTLEPPGLANVCRALLSEPPDLGRREGTEQQGPLWRVEAMLAREEQQEDLDSALIRAGASDLHRMEVLDERRRFVSRMLVVVGDEGLSAVRLLLHEAGAVGVIQMPAEHHQAGVCEVTVSVGSGMKKPSVRIREILAEGRLLRAEPDADDLNKAASALGVSAATVRWDALSAYKRLHAGSASTKDE